MQYMRIAAGIARSVIQLLLLTDTNSPMQAVLEEMELGNYCMAVDCFIVFTHTHSLEEVFWNFKR
jgi:hypothetical protein